MKLDTRNYQVKEGAHDAHTPLETVTARPATHKETPMTSATQTPTAQTSAQGDSNAAVLRAKLTAIGGMSAQVSDHADALAKIQAQMAATVRDADEFAQATGQSDQARQALDAATTFAGSMTGALDQFSAGADATQEQIGQASDGLRAAEHAEDALRSVGADGRAVAPAGAHA